MRDHNATKAKKPNKNKGNGNTLSISPNKKSLQLSVFNRELLREIIAESKERESFETVITPTTPTGAPPEEYMVEVVAWTHDKKLCRSWIWTKSTGEILRTFFDEKSAAAWMATHGGGSPIQLPLEPENEEPK